jgi:7-carboxy-7-deazaguanine synthase
MAEAHLAEVFSSIQGEGIYVGQRQVFCRVSGCNLRCSYCDTPETQEAVGTCTVQTSPDGGEPQAYDNPTSARQAVGFIERLDVPRGLHHCVAVTGGEPLLAAGFVAELASAVRDLGLGVYLETNGTLPQALGQVLRYVDVVALDVKLPSAVGGVEWFGEARESLEACRGVDAFVKVVLTPEATEAELVAARDTVAAVSEDVPFVLQPVTPVRGVMRPSREQVLRAMRIAGERLRDVRVIPQVHKLMSWR